MEEKKRHAKAEYKSRPRPSGIFKITNNANGKILVGSALNLDGMWNRHRFQLRMGVHMNKELQRDWDQFGEASFSFEVIDEVDPDEAETGRVLQEYLKDLEDLWLEKLQPFGDKGYNRARKQKLN